MTSTILQTPATCPHRSPERYNIASFHLPVLLYRACLPSNPTASNITSFLEPNHWVQELNPQHVTHQCLAVFKGHSRLLLGKVNEKDTGAGIAKVKVDLYERDVIVIPAGVVHRSIDGDYEHVVFYPKVQKSARFHEIGDGLGHLIQLPLPEHDPIFGVEGPLVGIWNEAEKAWLNMAGL